MSKILNIDDLLDAAEEVRLPTFNLRRRQLEMTAEFIAEDLAQFLDINVSGARWGPGGLCVDFNPKHRGQECPKVITDADLGGEWGLPEEDVPVAPTNLNRKKRRPIRVWLKSLFLSKEVKQCHD